MISCLWPINPIPDWPGASVILECEATSDDAGEMSRAEILQRLDAIEEEIDRILALVQ